MIYISYTASDFNGDIKKSAQWRYFDLLPTFDVFLKKIIENYIGTAFETL